MVYVVCIIILFFFFRVGYYDLEQLRFASKPLGHHSWQVCLTLIHKVFNFYLRYKGLLSLSILSLFMQNKVLKTSFIYLFIPFNLHYSGPAAIYRIVSVFLKKYVFTIKKLNK